MTAIETNPAISLEELLAYRHNGALRRYAKEQHASMDEAADVFQEMLKFLYLSAHAANDETEPFGCAISEEIEKIDWMWHTFLLFTMDYADFCERYFGFFLHHVPNEDEEETQEDEDAVRAAVQKQLEFVYDVLGEETLIAWYDRCRYAAAA